MRKILYSLAFAAVLLVSCEEWEPVFTKYGDDPTFKPVEMTPNITIAELKALYQKEGDPVKIDEELIIGGQVVSEDRSGNIYKELYIQDASGASDMPQTVTREQGRIRRTAGVWETVGVGSSPSSVTNIV